MTTPVSRQCSLLHCLHMDLINEILLRLPIKSLLRFKSACKTWQTMITSSYFMYQHLGRESNRNDLIVCWSTIIQKQNLKTYGIYNVDTLKLVDSVSLLPNGILESRCKDFCTGVVTAVSGPCNGIICVYFNQVKFALWNPATRKLWPIPEGPVKLNLGVPFSFWIDPLTREFKVFWVPRGVPYEEQAGYVTYKSCNDSWRVYRPEEVPFLSGDYVPPNQCSRYSVSHGFYYFLKVNLITSYNANIIITYDIHNDLFQNVHMPNIENTWLQEISLDLYGDSLAMFVRESDLCISGEVRRIDIWVMKEGRCWSKLFNVDMPGKSEPLGFWNGNKFCVTCHTSGELMIYDAVSGERLKLEVEKTKGATHSSFFPLCYKESLISLKT